MNKKGNKGYLLIISIFCIILGLSVHYVLEKTLDIYISPFFPVLLIFTLLTTILMLLNNNYIKQFIKQGKKVNAEVISCVESTLRDDLGDITVEKFYTVTYYMKELDKETEVNIYNKKNVGTKVKGIYLEKSDEFVTINEFKTMSDQHAIVFLNICLYFLVAITLFFSFIRDKVILDWLLILYVFISVLLISAAAVSFYYFFYYLFERKNYEKVEARVIECLEKNKKNKYDDSILKVYYPVYEYLMDDEKREYLDDVTGEKRKVGEINILYYDRKTNKIIMPKSIIYYFLAGISSSIVLAVILIFGVY